MSYAPQANPAALTIADPLSLDDARVAASMLARQRRDAERFLEECVARAADTEHAYRKTLALSFVTLKEGLAAAKEADARSRAADAARDRDIAAGMVKVAQERLKGLEGERAMLRQLMEFSMKQGVA